MGKSKPLFGEMTDPSDHVSVNNACILLNCTLRFGSNTSDTHGLSIASRTFNLRKNLLKAACELINWSRPLRTLT